ncbi:hypothetical protein [Actinosynnema sp. NPDC023587]|uniref:glycine-rich domain-containing protein n=1 Tax=Actinosynnema sp. NPDC023587 TaxID=3154695 RepID=UPI0033C704B5
MSVTTERAVAARTLVSGELFRRLVVRVAAEERAGLEWAERVVDQAIAFVAACGTLPPDARMSPSPAVDIGWHTLILYTREYAELCGRVVGRFVHHQPDDEPGDRAGAEGGVSAVEVIRRAGYRVDPELWPRGARGSADCYEDGNCGASGAKGDENQDTRLPPP